MADEIRFNIFLKVTKDGLSINKGDAQTIDFSGTRYSAGVQDIGTSAEQIVLGSDQSSVGFAYFRNAGASAFLDIGVKPAATFYPLVRLLVGESCAFRISSSYANLYALADTGGSKIEYLVLEA
jgi:hypothetical protein